MPDRPDGTAFKVFPQNPFAFRVAAGSQPKDFLAEVRLTPRGKLWSGQPDDDPTVKGFGDDQIYVANYCHKVAYESLVPAPHNDTLTRPPSLFLMGPLPTPLDGGYGHLDPGGWDRLSDRNGWDRLSGRKQPVSVCASAFAVAMVYAIARQTIDLWEGYVGREIAWYCAQEGRAQRRRRLEIVPLVARCGSGEMHKNAVSGYGYIELGVAEPRDSDLRPAHQPHANGDPALPPPALVPYWLNADTVAHEIGHQILYATLGFGGTAPAGGNWLDLGGREMGQAFRAFHESFGDIVAIMTALQSDRLLDAVLDQTGGFLFQDTALTNIGEITATRTIRDVHKDSADAVAGEPAALGPDEELVRGYYALSEKLTGTFFDMLVGLAARFLPGLDLALVEQFEHQVGAGEADPGARAPLENAVRALFEAKGRGPFKDALRQASAALGEIFGEYLRRPGLVDPAHFTTERLRAELVAAGHRRIGAKPASALARVDGPALARSIGRIFDRRGLAAR